MKNFVVALLVASALFGVGAAHAADNCQGGLQTGACGSLAADQARGDFHGLIMVRDDPSVLDRAAVAGTKAGCADCVWEVILACDTNRPATSGDLAACAAAANAAGCKPGQELFRLYLSNDSVTDMLDGTVCLGNVNDVIPIGNIAAADVQRYLKDVAAPTEHIAISPPRGVPANIAAYFQIRTPTQQPQPFGNGLVRETITLAPQQYLWDWGDGTASGWTTDIGGPYPSGTLTHTYATSARLEGSVTTRWGGTYTVTVGGRTFGPYDAIGTVTRTQPFAVTVLAARSETVSTG